MKDQRKKKEYLIIADTRALSSSYFSSDTTIERLKVKGINKLNKNGGDMKNVG